MKELVLSQQYAVIALDGLESLHPSMAKSAVIRAIAAAKVMEEVMHTEAESDPAVFILKLNEAVEGVKDLRKKDEKQIEEEMAGLLEADGLMEQIPDILGCDMDYYTAGVELKAYRSDEDTYIRIREGLRAEILEEGVISTECAVLLWLLRESGCIHDLFSVSEQDQVQRRMTDAAAENEIFRAMWQTEFHSAVESFAGRFLRAKHNLFKNPYLEGVNLIFPYLERRKAIFIDFVVFGTDVRSRRIAIMEHLSKMGHYVEEVKSGSETLLKIDNAYYRIFPTVKRAYKVPIQGANLVPVYQM
ncbi:MAG TPA: hypothetical protein H9959_09910 [Candidatus Mediterraneibacter ornithocaccae]|jgi:hypothetical protein|uniref:hypothetical protein n=1 Tax=Mediterraneibacter glycyrrhizinilyticus TaxID=342942 RepID=UPI001F97F3A7|nr:hypothetical protein [Mediterraneibacter glycyrrhizinilyticus]MDN0044813.1 hypothetical protein [Mediterraneibacter glycyrrhizinilyticus]MDN0062418.1 hypothetical protein [Mediterraneibacter glycyrrhizinilyticus]HJA20185.1 hypothetical protein [Candidatus Mediterraneibacter ornithocaccae]